MQKTSLLSEAPHVGLAGFAAVHFLQCPPPKKKQKKKTPLSLLNRLPVEVSGGRLSFSESLLTEGHIPRKMVKLHKTSQLSRIANEESPR